MRRHPAVSLVAVAGLCLLASRVLAQFPPITDPNKDEVQCMKGAGLGLLKFLGAGTKCASKCIASARKTAGPYNGCFGPAFSDPATNACIFDPVKGAQARARASVTKGCSKDCPECYMEQSPTLCATGEPFVTDTQSQIDPLGNLVFCAEAIGGSVPTEVAKCEDTVLKSLVKFVGQKTKCYQKCFLNVQKGKIPPSCYPPVPEDPATAACIFDPVTGVEAKTAAAIDKVCTSATKPACYAGMTGAGWVALAESQVDFRVPITICGSPSGAFVD